MNLGPHDLHLEFDAVAERLTVWSAAHVPLFWCPARNRTVSAGDGHWGHLPPGEYRLSVPEQRHSLALGAWFIPVVDAPGQHGLADRHRSGIGLHGGGSGLPDPFAPLQGWSKTHGCVRLQNKDLAEVVARVTAAQHSGGQCYLTVVGRDR